MFKFNKKHLIIVVVIIIIIIVLALIRINHKTPDDGLKYNKNKSFTKTQTVKGIVFKNIKCTFDGKVSLKGLEVYDNIYIADGVLYLKEWLQVHYDNYDNLIRFLNKIYHSILSRC